MRRFVSLFVLVSALSLIATVTSSSGAAPAVLGHGTPSISASGTFTYTSSTFNSTRSAGGNTFIDLSATVSYTGTFSGISTVQGTLIIHADGSANFYDVETFTGTVNGVTGTVTFNLTGRNGPSVDIGATDTIVSATGDLAGLHGVLSEVATLGANGPIGT